MLMQNNQVLTFIRKLSNNETLDLSQYKDPRFCKDLKKYTLKKIQALLIELAEIHLSFEGRPDRFYLSTFINRTDNNGFNMLDYCIIAGLDEFPILFGVLGCELHQNVVNFYDSVQEFYDVENAPKLILKINNAFHDLQESKKQNIETPLTKKLQLAPGCVEKIREKLKTHNIAILLIFIGVFCLISTPFTVGANSRIGTIILCSVGIPALYSGLSDFQHASIAKMHYDQAEAHTRTMHEGKILRVALALVTQHIFEAENQSRITLETTREYSKNESSNQMRSLIFRTRNQESTQQQQKPVFKRVIRSISI